MIIDTFIFYNEIKMLNFRLEELYDKVDFFVIIESKKTFALNDKQLYYNDNKKLFNKYSSKIINKIVDFNDHNPWANEHMQRNTIVDVLSQMSLSDTDIVIVSDVDEIPDIDSINSCDADILHNGVSLQQDMYYYNIENKIGEKWLLSVACSYNTIKKYQTTQNLRNSFRDFAVLPNGGWHFSFFGDINFIINKIQNYSHQEFNNDKCLNVDHIKKCILNHKDVLNRDKENRNMNYLPIINNKYLPKNYKLLM
jgi:beta-1,4-mannosyl-glycoprotein beta-1,4-N-acetylglucosaminyltransferase